MVLRHHAFHTAMRTRNACGATSAGFRETRKPFSTITGSAWYHSLAPVFIAKFHCSQQNERSGKIHNGRNHGEH